MSPILPYDYDLDRWWKREPRLLKPRPQFCQLQPSYRAQMNSPRRSLVRARSFRRENRAWLT